MDKRTIIAELQRRGYSNNEIYAKLSGNQAPLQETKTAEHTIDTSQDPSWVQSLAQGFNRCVANVAGLPVDLVNLGANAFGVGFERPILGSQWIQELGGQDQEEMRKRVMEVVQAGFKPEFLNRIDEIIIFNNLTREDIKHIVEIQMQHLKDRLQERKLSITLTDTAKELLCERGYDPTYGARPLKRAIQKYIQDPLALKILEGAFVENDAIIVDVDPDRNDFTFNKKSSVAAA